MTGIAYAHGSFSLDATRRCEVPGCDWHIALPERRCFEHGGADVTAYKTTAFGRAVYHFTSGDAELESPITEGNE